MAGARRWRRRRQRAAGALSVPARSAGAGELNEVPGEPGACIADPRPAAAAAPAATALLPVFEFDFASADAARIARAAAIAPHRAGRPRTSALVTIWHDTPGNDLFERGMALGRTRDVWRLEPLLPDMAAAWYPAAPAPVFSEASRLEDLPAHLLGRSYAAPVIPIAALKARLREIPLMIGGAPARIAVLEGTMRGVAQDRPVCRLILSGEPGAMAALALDLAAQVPLLVPVAGLASQALAIARDTSPAPRRLGAPAVPVGASVAEALTGIVAHLTEVILYWATQVPEAASPEAVHQMRVGVRRLRSAFSVFRKAVRDEPGWLDDLAAQLKALAAWLGAARDWDVFLGETAEAVWRAFPEDARVERLLVASGRKRSEAYDQLRGKLNAEEWRILAVRLAVLPTSRPWERSGSAGQSDRLAEPAADYAAQALDRRLKHVLAFGQDLSGLPVETLHDIRKRAKALRYGIEFFAPLFGEKAVRKYLPKLEDLQEDFGALNDAAVIGKLMDLLGNRTQHAFASGVMHGFAAATRVRAAKRLRRRWAAFYRSTPFWD